MEETLAAIEKFEPEVNTYFVDPGSRKASEETVKDSHLHPHKSANAWAEFNFRQKGGTREKAIEYLTLHISKALKPQL